MRPIAPEAMTPDALLAQADFVRSLARSLVADPHRAEDVAQETLVAALETPPREAPAVRSWLRSVMRNVVRQTHRADSSRQARELRRNLPATPDRPDDIAQQRETVRDLVQSLLEVREPYQTAIFLRYYENLTPRRIAKRLDIPLETVKSRLKRGLRELRSHMDERAGGDRHAWQVALVGLLGLPSGASIAPQPTTGGESAMTTWLMKLIIGASLVATSVVLVVVTTRHPGSSTGSGDVASIGSSYEAVTGEGLEVFEAAGPPAAGETILEVAEGDAADGLAVPFRVHVVDESGVPISGARVARRDAVRDREEAPADPVELGVTDAAGVLHAGAPASTFTLMASAEGFAHATIAFDETAPVADDVTLMLGKGAAISGVVRFEDDTAAGAGVRVYACLEGGCLDAIGLRREMNGIAAGSIVETDSKGRFRIDGLLDGEHYQLIAGAPGIGTLRAPSTRDPQRRSFGSSAGALAGGDDVEIIVGYLYGAAARLTEAGGVTPRISARVEREEEVLIGVGGGGVVSAVRSVFHDDPMLALAGIDVVALHPRLPVPKHVDSCFFVLADRVDRLERSRYVSRFGYEETSWELTAERANPGVPWSNVELTPSDEIETGTVRVVLDMPSADRVAARRQSSSLGRVSLQPVGDGVPLLLALAPGEVDAELSGVPAGFYHARFRSRDHATVIPRPDVQGIPVEIGDGPVTLRFDLTELGSLRIDLVDSSGRPYTRAASFRVEPTDPTRTDPGQWRAAHCLDRAPYHIPVLEPGEYSVTAFVRKFGHFALEPMTATVYASDTTAISIDVPAQRSEPRQTATMEVETSQGLFFSDD